MCFADATDEDKKPQGHYDKGSQCFAHKDALSYSEASICCKRAVRA